MSMFNNNNLNELISPTASEPEPNQPTNQRVSLGLDQRPLQLRSTAVIVANNAPAAHRAQPATRNRNRARASQWSPPQLRMHSNGTEDESNARGSWMFSSNSSGESSPVQDTDSEDSRRPPRKAARIGSVNARRRQNNNHANNGFVIPSQGDGGAVLRQYFQGGSLDFNQDSSNTDLDAESRNELAQAKLRILAQPEDRHRARYLSEGSRGAVKDRTGTSYCTIQLTGYNRPTTVNIYAGANESSGQAHSLYRVIRVTGKGGSSARTTPCTEHEDSKGVHYLQIQLRPEHSMTAVLDCVGILKVCAHTVKRHVNRDKKQAYMRLVFCADIRTADGKTALLQTLSAPIHCMQQMGHPEVNKCSLQQSDAMGGTEMFIIGRNFDRTTSVLFREYKTDGKLAWSAEACMDKPSLHQCHLVCSVPTYRNVHITAPVEVSVTVKCANKTSHPMSFYYLPTGHAKQSTDWSPPEAGAQASNHDAAPIESVVPKTEVSMPTPAHAPVSVFMSQSVRPPSSLAYHPSAAQVTQQTSPQQQPVQWSPVNVAQVHDVSMGNGNGTMMSVSNITSMQPGHPLTPLPSADQYNAHVQGVQGQLLNGQGTQGQVQGVQQTPQGQLLQGGYQVPTGTAPTQVAVTTEDWPTFSDEYGTGTVQWTPAVNSAPVTTNTLTQQSTFAVGTNNDIMNIGQSANPQTNNTDFLDI